MGIFYMLLPIEYTFYILRAMLCGILYEGGGVGVLHKLWIHWTEYNITLRETLRLFAT